MRSRPGRRAVLAVLALSAVAGCGGSGRGGSSHTATSSASRASSSAGTVAHTAVLPGVCPGSALAYIGRVLGGPVTAVRGESGQATPQCVFRAGVGARRARVTVVVDGYAQPYQRLERTQIEDAQQFGTRRLEALPTPIAHVGIDAYWFLTERKVMTTEGRRLISVFVAGRGLSTRRIRATAIAVARRYLGPNDLKAADPSGT